MFSSVVGTSFVKLSHGFAKNGTCYIIYAVMQQVSDFTKMHSYKEVYRSEVVDTTREQAQTRPGFQS